MAISVHHRLPPDKLPNTFGCRLVAAAGETEEAERGEIPVLRLSLTPASPPPQRIPLPTPDFLQRSRDQQQQKQQPKMGNGGHFQQQILQSKSITSSQEESELKLRLQSPGGGHTHTSAPTPEQPQPVHAPAPMLLDAAEEVRKRLIHTDADSGGETAEDRLHRGSGRQVGTPICAFCFVHRHQ